jgi:hypothetical protein
MRRTREQWAALVATFERTDQAASRFCASRGIRVKTFAWWRWQLRKAIDGPRRGDAVRLLPVGLVEHDGGRDGRLTVAVGEVEIRFDVGVDVAYVAALVGRLRGA